MKLIIYHSRVLLLNDLNSRIPVTFGEEGIQAILKGNGGSKPILEYLPEGFIIEREKMYLHQEKMEYFFQDLQSEQQH